MSSHIKKWDWFFGKIRELGADPVLSLIEIRTVMVRTSDWAHYASCVFAPSNLLRRVNNQPIHMIYPKVALLSKEIPLKEITSYDDIFAAMQNWGEFGSGAIDIPELTVGDVSVWFPGSHNSFTELPVWTYTIGSQPNVRPPDEPLLSPNLPLYQDVVEAASAWLWDSSISFNRYPSYTCRFLLTNSRAYIKDIHLDRNHILQIKITHLRGQENLILHLTVKQSDGTVNRDFLSVTKEVISYAIPHDITGITVYLVDQNGEPQDFFEETPYRSSWNKSVLKAKSEIANTKAMAMPQNVFVVHGHDLAMRDEVTKFIQDIGYTPIVLQERPNLGRTVIEKFEQEAANIAFAIVLMSPDDLGATVAHATEQNLRARQNVIYELGYFQAKLGREKVSLLRKGNVEIPSDIYGVVYITFDTEGDWKRQLTKEMQAADMEITPPITKSTQTVASGSRSHLLSLPNLKVPKADVAESIKKQIEAGTAIAKRRIRTATGLEPAQIAQEHWDSYNIELLRQSFDGTSLVAKYEDVTATPNATYQRASRGRTIMRAEIERGIRLLISILEQLELLSDVTVPPTHSNKDGRQAELYDLLAELKDVRSKYIRFSRGSRRDDPDEHERLISSAQKIITRASRFEDKRCPTEALQMIIPSHAGSEEVAKFKLLHEAAKDSLIYIGDIWLTVNQVTKNVNFAEFQLWGEYEDRNISALDQGIKRISTLINQSN